MREAALRDYERAVREHKLAKKKKDITPMP
jgi:hypothetical protein